MLARLSSSLRSMVTRGKVTAAIVGPRTLLQITGLEGEVKHTVELLLPPGYSARPVAGADVTVFQVLGSRDHMVALGGDTSSQDAISNLAPGEFGLRHASGLQQVMRNGGTLEVTGATFVHIACTGTVEIDAPLLRVSGDIVDNYATNSHTMAQMRAIYDIHTHNVENVQAGGTTRVSDVPNQLE